MSREEWQASTRSRRGSLASCPARPSIRSGAPSPSGWRSCGGRASKCAGPVAFLKRLLDLARQLVDAERAEADGRLDQFRVIDPDNGALTQILEEYAPPGTPLIVENVVEDIDAIVSPIRGTRWQKSQPGDREVRRQLRLVLRSSGLPPVGQLYNRAYAYIREHYCVRESGAPVETTSGPLKAQAAASELDACDIPP